MPGMNSGLNPADPTIVNAFRSALLHQWLIAAAIFVLLLLVWGATRTWVTVQVSGAGAAGPGGTGGTAEGAHPQDADATAQAPAADAAPQETKAPAEPRARRLLRIGFGLIWIFDGILQAQPKMAAGMPSQVIAPTAASSPAWVQHLVNWGGTIWSYHPVQAGASAVWIQVGIGLWLIVAERGWWSRAAGLASVGWGLVVWVFGESFGGDLRPRPYLAVRRARRGAVLCGRRGAHRAARTGLADAQDRPADPGRDGNVLHRHGGAAGLARTRLLAGHRGRPAGHPHRHGAVDVPDIAAAPAVRLGLFLRVVHRRARVRA